MLCFSDSLELIEIFLSTSPSYHNATPWFLMGFLAATFIL